MKKKTSIAKLLIIGTFFLVMALVVFFFKQLHESLPPKKLVIHTIAHPTSKHITHIFLIVMENHNWSAIIKDDAPFITKTLLPLGAHATQYYNPPGNHPSEPNYIWLEAGTNFGITNDSDPTVNNINSSMHLTTLLTKAGYTWKSYVESINGTDCPLHSYGLYAAKHVGPIFFDDITNNNNPQSATCIKHIRPFSELQTDLKNNTVPNYSLITPNVCDDMHSCPVSVGDAWLAKTIPTILNSQAYQEGGAIFITWDEGEGGDGPIGMIVLSPFVKKNYTNSIHYDHSSYVKTVEEIFGLKPLLDGAKKATDLSNFFTINIQHTDNK